MQIFSNQRERSFTIAVVVSFIQLCEPLSNMSYMALYFATDA